MPVNSTIIPSIATIDSFAEWLVSSNLSFARVGDIITLLNSVESDTMGGLELTDLLTTDKTSLLEAINSFYTEYTSSALITAITGLLADLTTTNKDNLVDAINELDTEIGVLSSLTTTANTTLVAAVNELVSVKVTKTSNTGAVIVPTGTTAQRDGAPANGYFRYNSTDNAFEGYINGVWSSIAVVTNWLMKSAAYTTFNGERIGADVSGGAWQLDLPATPVVGASVIVAVINGDVTVNNLTISGNGNTIQGGATVVFSVVTSEITIIFDGTEWRTI